MVYVSRFSLRHRRHVIGGAILSVYCDSQLDEMTSALVFVIYLCCSLSIQAAAKTCPGRCQCVDTIVNCSGHGSGIRFFPWTLPAHTTELYLQNNSLASLPLQLLQELPMLRVLNIAYNRISTVSSSILERLLQLETLNLEGNPLHCSCRIAPLVRLVKFQYTSRDLSVTDARELRCKTPQSVADLPVRLFEDVKGTCNDRAVRSLRRHVGAQTNRSVNGSAIGNGFASGSGSASGSGFGGARGNGSEGSGIEIPTGSVGSGMLQYVQSFVMELKNANCTEWKQNPRLVASFAEFFISSLNDHPGCNGACDVNTDQVDITPTCGSVVLSITLKINSTSVPDGVDANDLVEYFVGDVVTSLNKSSDGSLILTLGGQTFNLGRVCGSTSNCSIVIRTDAPEQPVTPTQEASQPLGISTNGPTTRKTDAPTREANRPTTPAAGSENQKGGGVSKTIVAIAVVCGVVGALVLAVVVIWVCRKKRSQKYSLELQKARTFWGNMFGSKEADDTFEEGELGTFG